MPPNTVPTRQALRHLRRLCDTTDNIAASHFSLVGRSSHIGSRPVAANPHVASAMFQLDRSRPFSTVHAPLRQQQQPSSPSPSPGASQTAPPSPTLPDITNFYTLFPSSLPRGPPPSGPFEIPLSTLKREFLQLQSQHHPDKYTTSPTSHSKSLALSSLLNNAYKTLSDPLLRARYLLAHTYDVDITSEDNSTHRGVTDQATLMEVMEAQEAIEEARDQEQIDALKVENRSRIQEAERNLGRAFETEDVHAAKTECVRLNYWRTLQQGLDDWEPGKEVRLIH